LNEKMKQKDQTATELRNLLKSLKHNTERPDKYAEDGDALVKTRFPDFHLNVIPSGCTSGNGSPVVIEDDSDDEPEFVEARKEAYRGKVDKDVAVFLRLAEQMSPESLIFLLQGQARAQNLNQEYLEECKKRHDTILEDSDNSVDRSSSSNKKEDQRGRSLANKKAKHFRFAEVTNNEARTVVYELEPMKEESKRDLWWQEDEVYEIRQNAIYTVKFFRRYCEDYIGSIEKIFEAKSTTEPEIQRLIKKLSIYSFTRGLEGHIVPLFANRRSLYRRSVIEWQREIEDEFGKDYDRCSEALAEASIVHTHFCSEFAATLGQIDHVEALKASMSQWH
jgi:hypothetical protein